MPASRWRRSSVRTRSIIRRRIRTSTLTRCMHGCLKDSRRWRATSGFTQSCPSLTARAPRWSMMTDSYCRSWITNFAACATSIRTTMRLRATLRERHRQNFRRVSILAGSSSGSSDNIRGSSAARRFYRTRNTGRRDYAASVRGSQPRSAATPIFGNLNAATSHRSQRRWDGTRDLDAGSARGLRLVLSCRRSPSAPVFPMSARSLLESMTVTRLISLIARPAKIHFASSRPGRGSS